MPDNPNPGGGGGSTDKPPGQFTNHEVTSPEQAASLVRNLLENGFAVQVTGYKDKQ